MPNISSSLAKNSILQIGGRLLGTLFGLVTFFFLLRFYDTPGYGDLTSALTFVSLFAILVDFGLTLTTTQMISEEGANEERILGNLLTLRGITAVLFLACAPIAALFIPSLSHVLLLIAISAASSFFGSMAQTFVGVFQKRITLTIPVLAETANRFVALTVIVVTGFLAPSLMAATAAFLLGAIVQCIIMVSGTASLVRLRPRLELSVWRDILMKSWPIGLSIFFNLLYLKGDIFFMSIFHVPSEIIGQYGAAYKVVDVVTMVPVTFMGLMLPLLAHAWSSRDEKRFNKHLQDTFDLFSLIAIPFAVGAGMVGVALMTLVKEELTLAGELLVVLGPAASVVFFNSLYGYAIVALKKQKIMTIGYLAVAVVALFGYIRYIPLDGVWAAAIVTLVSEALIGLLTFGVVTYASGYFPRFTMLLRAIVASLVMGFVLLYVPVPHVLIAIPMGIVVYVGMIALLGGPSPRMLVRLFFPEKRSA